MTSRADIVREARSWLGTRWQHQASTKGVACDCVGLVRGVAVATGAVQADWQALPGIEQFYGYGRAPFGCAIERMCALYFEPIAPQLAGPGDLVLMQFSGEADHMGILGTYHGGGLSLIHSYAPRRCVIETRLDEGLRARIVSWHRFRGVQA